MSKVDNESGKMFWVTQLLPDKVWSWPRRMSYVATGPRRVKSEILIMLNLSALVEMTPLCHSLVTRGSLMYTIPYSTDVIYFPTAFFLGTLKSM